LQANGGRWVTVDSKEFHLHDLEQFRTALIEAAEHVESL
jgi:hypothetical protein